MFTKLLENNKPKLVDYEKFIKTIEKELIKQLINAEVTLGGSVAKGTFLKDPDYDVFVRFQKPDSDLLEKVLKKCFSKVDRIHGSRDYFQVKYKGQIFEIIPVKKISKASEAENVTDVSKLHVDWVRENVKDKDQVRLAKLFCKAQGIYGAESYISGFSGYILEILVYAYGSFEKLLQTVAVWKPKTIIDVSGFYKNNKDVLKKLNESKIHSPLIIIDPVQKDRNASASVSMEQYSRFILAARKFLDKQDISMFHKHPFSLSDINKDAKKHDTKLIILHFKLHEGKIDVISSKAIKIFHYIKMKLIHHDFEVFKSGIELNENLMWFQVLPHKLPEFAKQIGPKSWVAESNVKSFLDKYSEVYLDEDTLVAIRKRKFIDSKDLVSDLLKEEYVSEKLKKIWMG